jgi:hypothetical protein
MGHMHYFLRNLRHPIWKAGLVSIHSPSEKESSRQSGFKHRGFSETKFPALRVLGSSEA